MPRIDGEPAYRCRDCLDDGLILVIHPRSMKAVGANPDYTGPLYSCGVRCSCRAGEKWKGVAVFFDHLRMVPCEFRPSITDRVALREHVMQSHAGTAFTGQGFEYAGSF